MLPRTPGRHIPSPPGEAHDRPCSPDAGKWHARTFTRRGAAFPRDRAYRFPHRGRSVCDPGNPAVADAALRGHARRHELCRECQHHGHGDRRPGGRLLQPAYRPQARHSREPRAARHSHHPAGVSARSHDLHAPSHRAGPLHGLGLCADAGLSRRTVQRDGCRRCVRGLYRRQCCEQPGRPADLGCCGRHVWPGVELLPLCAAQPLRCGAGLLHHPARAADACHAGDALAPFSHDRALAQPRFARPLPSASASCSPSSAHSPSSTSCWCARRSRSA